MKPGQIMTVADLIEQLKTYPGDTVLYAYDGDYERFMPVTGFVYTPRINDINPTIEFSTDETSKFIAKIER